MNRLINEKSPYLRGAAHQKINWYPWCEEAFERARLENKPIFLSSGAEWCHWCHVMAKESFEDLEIAEILNNNFICIKIDRDERPDIDRRYQMAVAAMGGGGGWPLSVFLTHDKTPFFGGTYFPVKEGFGRPGFKTLLNAIAELYKVKKGEIIKASREIAEVLRQNSMTVKSDMDINPDLLDMAFKMIMDDADFEKGGFGHAPKFPMSGAIDFLLGRYYLEKDEKLGHFLKNTLYKMAMGGIYDQLAGGFHRYSTDPNWIIPHFEKMLDDNIWLLKNYADAYSIFHDEFFKQISFGIINFIRDELHDENGGFYANQGADVDVDDEGGYFTWSKEEFSNALEKEELEVLGAYFLHDEGSLHHNPEKMVLFIKESVDETARKIGMTAGRMEELIERGKKKLISERNKRQKPYVDITIYTSLNGMAASIFLKVYQIFKLEDLKECALKAIERILNDYGEKGVLFHSHNIKAMLDDYVNFIDALISAYEVTGNKRYIIKAEDIMKECIDRLWDKDGGGFFDSEEDIMGIRIKGIDDSPHPSANSLAIIILLKLSKILKDTSYNGYLEDIIKTFVARANSMGIHAGYFFTGLNAYFNMYEITIQNLAPDNLKERALSFFYPYKTIRYEDGGEKIIFCVNGVCHEPFQV
ncbi:MAG TPA: thioredoxin domain-containing protein [Syntrophorhabdaceae bacterium]|nr:thioredoxin domain-containing protein [Syntrophorhabdaceae bacterium]